MTQNQWFQWLETEACLPADVKVLLSNMLDDWQEEIRITQRLLMALEDKVQKQLAQLGAIRKLV